MKKVKIEYSILMITKGGSVTDKRCFDTLSEAKEEIEFMKKFYKGGGYKFMIERKEVCEICLDEIYKKIIKGEKICTKEQY